MYDRKIGELIDQALGQKHYTPPYLARRLHEAMGYKSVSPASAFIRALAAGHIHNSHIDMSIRAVNVGRQRTAIVLYALGVDENSPLLKKLRKLDPQFSYPPRKGVSPDQIEAAQSILEGNLEGADFSLLTLDEKLALLGPNDRKSVEGTVDTILQGYSAVDIARR